MLVIQIIQYANILPTIGYYCRINSPNYRAVRNQHGFMHLFAVILINGFNLNQNDSRADLMDVWIVATMKPTYTLDPQRFPNKRSNYPGLTRISVLYTNILLEHSLALYFQPIRLLLILLRTLLLISPPLLIYTIFALSQHLRSGFHDVRICWFTVLNVFCLLKLNVSVLLLNHINYTS